MKKSGSTLVLAPPLAPVLQESPTGEKQCGAGQFLKAQTNSFDGLVQRADRFESEG